MQLKTIQNNFFSILVEKAHHTSSKRVTYQLHKDFSDPVQRMIHALTRETIVPPHTHPYSIYPETLIALYGEVHVCIYNEIGNVMQKYKMSPDECCIIEVPPNLIHSLVCHSDSAIVFECNRGPYFENNKLVPEWFVESK